MIAELAKSPSFTFRNDEYTLTSSKATAFRKSSNLKGWIVKSFKSRLTTAFLYPITDTCTFPL